MLRERLVQAMKESMKNHDSERLSTIRMVLAAIKQKDIDARPEGITDGIGEDQIVQLLQTMIKQRNESISLYAKAARDDLKEKEEREIEIILSFLPQQMTDEEIKRAIEKILTQIEDKSLKAMRQAMDLLKSQYAGQMDFGKASGILKTILSA